MKRVLIGFLVGLLLGCNGQNGTAQIGSSSDQPLPGGNRPGMAATQPRPAEEWTIEPELARKMDPALQQRLADIHQSSDIGRSLEIIGMYVGGEKELRHKIGDIGGIVRMVTDSTFTLTATAEQVEEIARLESVRYLELAKERQRY